MGIVEEELAAFEFADGTEHAIELNAGDTVHWHLGDVRLDMSIEEFHHFASVLGAARDRLDEVKDPDGEIEDPDDIATEVW
jgi:hypothetical protein